MPFNIHLLVVKRLFLVWLALTLVIGGAVYWYETHRLDEVVIGYIERESNITPQDAEAILSRDPDIYNRMTVKAEELMDAHFTVVDIYDLAQNHLAAVHRPGSQRLEQEIERRHHEFPLDEALHYERFVIKGEQYLQVLLPLRTAKGVIAGYLEGVYHIDRQTLAEIDRRVYRSVVLVTLVILITSIVLYPVILQLSSRLLRFARETLRDNVKLMEVLGSAIAVRDSDTHSHNYRVTLYAIHLAESRRLPAESIRNLISGAFLHDVGKIGISDSILRKPGKLDEEEFAIMREHVRLGLEIVSKAYWLTGARDVIEFHHEKYDGSGYLRGLKSMEIPLNARIFSIVDVFDALTSRRPYKEPYPLEKALAMLREGSGKDFDPVLVDAFEVIAPDLYLRYGNADETELEAVLMEREEKYYIEARLDSL